MNKGNLKGWKDVFSFTFIQTLKNKAFIITNIVLLILILVSTPVISMITGKSQGADVLSPVAKVYVNNATALMDIDFQGLREQEELSHIAFEALKEDYDVVAKRIDEKEKNSVILTLAENEGRYSLIFAKAAKGPIKESSLRPLSNAAAEQFEAFKVNRLGISDAQLALIQADVRTNVSMADVHGTEIIKEDTSISHSEYWFIYGLLFVLMMVNILSSTQIAYSIVTEKSSRVVEYLLTSVKPLAIMVGKIIAMLSAVLLQVISMLSMVLVSNKISAVLFPSAGGSMISQFLPKDLLQNLNIVNIGLGLLLFFIGMIFYAGLAGLTGATVSKLEEINEGLTLFTLTNLVGVYMGIGAAVVLMTKGVNSYVIFSFLFPLSSPFLLPGAILVGKASLPIAAAAIALQLLTVVLLFRFIAKVYETLILHNGSTIKFKQLIKISKTV